MVVQNNSLCQKENKNSKEKIRRFYLSLPSRILKIVQTYQQSNRNITCQIFSPVSLFDDENQLQKYEELLIDQILYHPFFILFISSEKKKTLMFCVSLYTKRIPLSKDFLFF